MKDQTKQDKLFATPLEKIVEFTFDAQVTAVFDDMIARSVPGYATTIALAGLVGAHYAQADSCGYDLGCSLGAGTLALRQYVKSTNFRIIAVDSSPTMVERCAANVAQQRAKTPVDIACADIRDVEIRDASVVLLNFTLQFIPPAHRATMLQRIYAGLKPGGVLVLSEKIAFANETQQTLFTTLHHEFKKANGYSELEIAQKRTALENVLIPETLAQHHDRLQQSGFTQINDWYQCLNFASMLAIK